MNIVPANDDDIIDADALNINDIIGDAVGDNFLLNTSTCLIDNMYDVKF